MFESEINEYISENYDEMITILKELCVIPAPSHHEHKRAEYCKSRLESMGADGVYIDSALNVIFPLNCDVKSEITVFAAHTDTVFPDTEPMPCLDDGEKIHCPGASDDTASVAVLMMMAKFFIEKRILPQKGILFVCNSCEEGLGNLDGTRQLFSDYEGRISQFITFDSSLNIVNDHCVGSHRYRVEVKTRGGHSYGDFGNKNAIVALSELVCELYKITVPDKPDTHTTYNVGIFDGGTSVNTIAQNAKMLCEYRSDDKECLNFMKKKFETVFKAAENDQVQLIVTKIGNRPCESIDPVKVERLKKMVVPVIESVTEKPVSFKSSSTDCNIPLSLGIPSLCIGVNLNSGIHTREEWVDKMSLTLGLEIAIKTGLVLTNNDYQG